MCVGVVVVVGVGMIVSVFICHETKVSPRKSCLQLLF